MSKSKNTQVMFGCSVDAHTAGMLDEIAEKYATSRAGGVRLAVRTAYKALMSPELPFSFTED